MDRHSIFIDWKTQYHFSLNTSISPNWDWGPFQSKSQKDVENLILKYTGECRETRIANMVSKKNKIGGSTAPHSSTLAWKIPWMEEPGRLQSMGSRRVGHGWATSLSGFTFMHWRRKWHPTPVFLPEESQGRGSLVGCRLWGHTELDTTEVT